MQQNELYQQIRTELAAVGYHFDFIVVVGLTENKTIGLFRDYFTLSIDEHVTYLNSILPLTMTASKVSRERIEIRINDFREHQLEHYTRRLAEAKTVEERAWLRNELYHLKDTKKSA